MVPFWGRRRGRNNNFFGGGLGGGDVNGGRERFFLRKKLGDDFNEVVLPSGYVPGPRFWLWVGQGRGGRGKLARDILKFVIADRGREKESGAFYLPRTRNI